MDRIESYTRLLAELEGKLRQTIEQLDSQAAAASAEQQAARAELLRLAALQAEAEARRDRAAAALAAAVEQREEAQRRGMLELARRLHDHVERSLAAIEHGEAGALLVPLAAGGDALSLLLPMRAAQLAAPPASPALRRIARLLHAAFEAAVACGADPCRTTYQPAGLLVLARCPLDGADAVELVALLRDAVAGEELHLSEMPPAAATALPGLKAGAAPPVAPGAPPSDTFDLFAAAQRLPGVGPFDLLAALVAHNQTLPPSLELDPDMLPLVAEWLGVRPIEQPDEPPETDLPERVAALSRILSRLKNSDYFGARHTSEDNFDTGVPGHLRGFANDARGVLLRLGLLQGKPTVNGFHIWLDPHRRKEIDELIAGRIEDAALRRLSGLPPR